MAARALSGVVAIPGARRPDTARPAAARPRSVLDSDAGPRFSGLGGTPRRPLAGPPASDSGEVVLVMGIPGAGKSRLAEDYVARGYRRLNRDERGGGLRELAEALEEELSSAFGRVVLDNTYLTRAARSYVIETASRHGIPAGASGSTPRSRRPRSTSSSACSRGSGRFPPPDELRGWRARRRACSLRRPRCEHSAGSNRRLPTRGLPRSRSCPSCGAAIRPGGRVRFRGGGCPAGARLGARSQSRPTDAPHLVFDWIPGGAPELLAAGRAPRRHGRRPG